MWVIASPACFEPRSRQRPGLVCLDRRNRLYIRQRRRRAFGADDAGFSPQIRLEFRFLRFLMSVDIANLCLHIPPPRAHLTRLYGAYSTRHRVEQARLRKSSKHGVAVRGKEPAAERSEETPSPALRKRKSDWARLISKVFEVDPHRCPCGGTRRIISVIIKLARRSQRRRRVRKIEPRANAPPPPAC